MLFAYSEVPESTTGFSPFELLYGREVRGPSDMLREKWRASKKSDESVLFHILKVRETLEEMSGLVSENARCAQKRQKFWYSQNARGKELQIGEKVLVVLPTTSNKLLACGPYSVLHRINKMNYEVHM